MITYPLETFYKAGIDHILLVTGKEHVGDFLKALGSGRDFHKHINSETPIDLRIEYEQQKSATGIADALKLAERFVGNDSMAVILGDNYFEKQPDFSNFSAGARIFLKEVEDPRALGVAHLSNGRIEKIVEKPKTTESKMAVTGAYIFDQTVFERVKTLKPSGRGELEVTDLNNSYLQDGCLDYRVVNGEWFDIGESIDHLHRTAQFLRDHYNGNNSNKPQ
jgi:glucose-1-phosphate thymidylyltransferase